MASTGIINNTMVAPLPHQDEFTDPNDPNADDPNAATGAAGASSLVKPPAKKPLDPGTGTGNSTNPPAGAAAAPNPFAAPAASNDPFPATPGAAEVPGASPFATPTAGADAGSGAAASGGAASVGAPSNAGTSGVAGAGAGAPGAGSTAWTPTQGIVDQIQGITPKSIDGQGYTAASVGDTPQATAEGYDATGYTAQQGTAVTSNENVSQAVDRIISGNSPLLQRVQSQAADASNSRGMLNSSMGVQAGQAAVLDKASELAAGDVQNAQFNAQQQNVMTINNVQQANAASAFHAEATNQAAAFAAAARNSASQFNSGEAQQKAEFAAQQWDAAAAFSAQAKQAADQFNATAYNDAMQRYTDAKNAAIAAQNDAENLSRRDAAQIKAGLEQAQIGANATVAAAQAHAGATIAAAQIGAQTAAANIKAQEEMQSKEIDATNTRFNLQLNQQQQQFLTGLNATEFNNFQSGLTNIETAQLEPDAKQNAINNYLSLWSASGQLPNVNITVPGGSTGT